MHRIGLCTQDWSMHTGLVYAQDWSMHRIGLCTGLVYGQD